MRKGGDETQMRTSDGFAMRMRDGFEANIHEGPGNRAGAGRRDSGAYRRAVPRRDRDTRAEPHVLRKRRSGLLLYLDDPDVDIDTNSLERTLRAIPMGRCNWLLCRTEVGARQVGIVQSLLMTCKLHEIDLYDYLVDVLQHVGQHLASRVHEFTPKRWKQLFAGNPLRALLHQSA